MSEPLKGKVDCESSECAVCRRKGNPCGVVFASDVKSAVEWLLNGINSFEWLNELEIISLTELIKQTFPDLYEESKKVIE